MLPTLRALLARDDLALRLATPAPAAALDAPVQWVHSSDLIDPTPFLAPGQVLLTTGTQFDQTDADDYVARLVDRGIAGLGFGTEVIRAGTPVALIESCGARGLPLFEVPYRTPFIAVARTTAELIAADAYARHTWALDAQRAISLAALRADGLHAALAELARVLATGVALFDAGGGLDRVFPADAIDPIALGVVRRDVELLLARGQRASATVEAGGRSLQLHTLGGRGRLRGVLAVGVDLDEQGREVVASVVGLASLALEQARELDRTRQGMRTGLVRALLAGETELVARVAPDLGGALPEGEVRVALVAVDSDRRDALDELLERRARQSTGALFFGRTDDGVLLVVDAAASRTLRELPRRFGARVGVSGVASREQLAPALAQARDALATLDEPGTRGFDELAALGIVDSLARGGTRELARAAIAPLTRHDADAGTELVATLRAWLEADAQYDRAAVALGVHRHTVRARIALAERVSGRDLGTFAGRAELWVALVASA